MSVPSAVHLCKSTSRGEQQRQSKLGLFSPGLLFLEMEEPVGSDRERKADRERDRERKKETERGSQRGRDRERDRERKILKEE